MRYVSFGLSAHAASKADLVSADPSVNFNANARGRRILVRRQEVEEHGLAPHVQPTLAPYVAMILDDHQGLSPQNHFVGCKQQMGQSLKNTEPQQLRRMSEVRDHIKFMAEHVLADLAS